MCLIIRGGAQNAASNKLHQAGSDFSSLGGTGFDMIAACRTFHIRTTGPMIVCLSQQSSETFATHFACARNQK